MTRPTVPSDQRGQHAAMQIPGLTVDSYNLALRDPQGEGFVGDRASQTAFRELLDRARRRCRTAKDPFGKTPAEEISKDEIDQVLLGGGVDDAHLVHVAVDRYARRLADVVRCFLAQSEWQGVERIVLGGGFTESETGGLAIRRTARRLEIERIDVRLDVLRHDADEGGLLGWVPLVPQDLIDRYGTFIAVDIGGSNIRCGLVEHRLSREPDGSKARVIERMHWRHADDEPSRDEAVLRTAGMINGLAAYARTAGLGLAPFVGIGCPGRMQSDGTIVQGAQNLPGNWESPFNLPDALAAHLEPIDGAPPRVVMHNDAVVQGLSERPRMRKARRWGVLTIGTGLGNASYTNV